MRSQNGPQEMKRIEAAPKQPGTAGPGNMLGYCLVSFHFLWAILWPHTVELPASPFRVIFWRDTLFPPGYFCASSFYGAVILLEGRKEGRKATKRTRSRSLSRLHCIQKLAIPPLSPLTKRGRGKYNVGRPVIPDVLLKVFLKCSTVCWAAAATVQPNW